LCDQLLISAAPNNTHHKMLGQQAHCNKYNNNNDAHTATLTTFTIQHVE